MTCGGNWNPTTGFGISCVTSSGSVTVLFSLDPENLLTTRQEQATHTKNKGHLVLKKEFCVTQPSPTARAFSELLQQRGTGAQDHQNSESPYHSGGVEVTLQEKQDPV
jgi:hypothetical protein